ncbi:MAG TPA: NAD+ synthase [Elusimicrobiota bacterium]|nr:NAD+ synthase [Elusimicrobiota bacterium]
MSILRVALAQINPTVGAIESNAEKIKDYALRANARGAHIVVFPELALTGYPPEDLLFKPQFLRDGSSRIARLAEQLPPEMAAIVGFADRDKRAPSKIFNAAAVIHQNRVAVVYHKQNLPNYGVFDEQRYFTPGESSQVLIIQNGLIGLTICEDIWAPRGAADDEARQGARLILNLSASPYHAGKSEDRLQMLRERVKETQAIFAYCNLVGGQDELVFDGSSLFMSEEGRLLAMGRAFEEDLLMQDIPWPPALINKPLGERKAVQFTSLPLNLPSPSTAEEPRPPAPAAEDVEEIYSALMLGTRDYVLKNGFQKVVVGLSGGIDSSLVACIAVDALGKENVIGVTMPSRFTSSETRGDAEELAKNLGIEFHALAIEPLQDLFLKSLDPVFRGKPRDLTEENLQARIRGVLLMALSNKFNWLVLTTGNKSEVSVGYCTLYGDTAGGFSVIKDIPKTLVYRLSRWKNRKSPPGPIPESVLIRPPTAELRPDQKDQDSLPEYETLDGIIRLAVEEDKSLDEVVRQGYDEKTVRAVFRMVDRSEYKRRQAPPGVKITPRAFGKDRRMPITQDYRESTDRS